VVAIGIGAGLSVLTLLLLGLKWELDKPLTWGAALGIPMVSSIVVSAVIPVRAQPQYLVWGAVWGLSLAVAISLLLWRFFRDPERRVPAAEGIIVSPADGTVIYVKPIRQGQIPLAEKQGRTFALEDFVQADVLPRGGLLIGIAMNYLDVHVNRAPIAGRVRLLRHIKGLFLSLKQREAMLENERVLTVIDNGQFQIGVVQIASRLVRKIVPYVQEGAHLQRGQRLGMIRFGSQVDVVLPHLPGLQIAVTPGMKIQAGTSILATCSSRMLCDTQDAL
jgi:phosphatidylserine decarboxylase